MYHDNTLSILTDTDSVLINEVGQLLVLLHPLLFSLVDTNTDQMWVHKLGPNRGQKVIRPEFHKRELSGVEDHDHLEVKGEQTVIQS